MKLSPDHAKRPLRGRVTLVERTSAIMEVEVGSSGEGTVGLGGNEEINHRLLPSEKTNLVEISKAMRIRKGNA